MVLMGLGFVFAVYSNAYNVGCVAFLNKTVSRTEQPLIYWLVCALPILFGIGLLVAGVYILSR